MAVCIPCDYLNKETTKLLVSLLTFESKQTYFETEKDKEDGFSAYRVEVFGGFKFVVVPFYFGIIFGAKMNIPVLTYRYRSVEDVPRINITSNLTFINDQEVVANEALWALQKYRGVLLQLHTGYGKTVTATYLIKVISMVTMIAVHRDFLQDQFKKTIEKYTNAKVCLIPGEKPNSKIDLNADVYVIMISSIHKVPLEVFARIGFLIVDEAHCYATKIRTHALMNIDTRYMAFLTATPSKIGEISKAFIGEHIIVRKFKRPFDVHIIDTNIDPVIESRWILGKERMDFDKYRKSIMNNEELNKYITYSVVRNQGRKILILTYEKKHVDLLTKMITDQGIVVSKFYGNQSSYIDAPVLISNCSKISIGFDQATTAMEYNGIKIDLLYQLVTYRDPTPIEQSIGRVLRAESPSVIYFTNNAGVSDNHCKVLTKWLKDMPATIYHHSKKLTPGSKDMNTVDEFLNGNTPVFFTENVEI